VKHLETLRRIAREQRTRAEKAEAALKDLFQSIDQAAHAKAIQWDRHSPTMTAARKALGL